MTLKINLHGDYLADWSIVPRWAIGVAVDVDGCIWAFAQEPKPNGIHEIWISDPQSTSQGKVYCVAELVQVFNRYDDPWQRIEIANWQDTWRERPGQEER